MSIPITPVVELRHRSNAEIVHDTRQAYPSQHLRFSEPAIHYPHRIASAPGHMKHAMNTSNITDQPQRIADFQSALSEAPRPARKNRLQIRKTHTSIAQKRNHFGAATCSRHDARASAEQNPLTETQ
jgi:hypothetical protein